MTWKITEQGREDCIHKFEWHLDWNGGFSDPSWKKCKECGRYEIKVRL